MKIGFLGFGNMAQAMAGGFVRSGAVQPGDIGACARDRAKLRRNTEPQGFRAFDDAAAVAEFFAARPEIRLAVDPVLVSTSGSRLLEDGAAEILENLLIPLAEVFTPNLDEGALLLGADKIENVADAARALYEKYGVPVLLKGGHLKGGAVTDVLFDESGPLEMSSARIYGVDTHGSGCTLSAAIAANFAKGLGLRDACRAAREYLQAGMSAPLKVGGRNFINHFPQK